MAATSEFEEFDRNAMECLREAFIGENPDIDESLNPSKQDDVASNANVNNGRWTDEEH